MTREEAIRKLQKQKAEYLEEWVDFSGVAEAYDMAIEALEQPIIRCKDCKYAYITNDGECKYCDIWFPVEAKYLDGDYYCASAERKDE